ncbi:MAG TPA: amidohydrolase family protein [Myxococcota bacterium]|nr:amidohydrolase family protein [Myxococcota bacterium]
MPWDLVIKNGTIIDGTGLPGFKADLAIRDGRIERIGRVEGDALRTVDAEGRIVAPGFIDVHTHYDVQLDWDPIASPSMQHGVTTVLTGNCGFTLYPAKPEDVGWLAGMLTRVEGMSKEALAEGFKWHGGDFAQYWARLEGKLGLNVGGYVGHCAVRRMVMGDEASERAASAEEIEAMQGLVRQAMAQGAVGFSTSQLDLHVGEDGRGVPSNFATPEEIVALCAVLAEFPHGVIEIIPRSHAEGHDEKDRALLLEMARASGKAIELGPLSPAADHPMGWENTIRFVREAREQGVRLHPQFSTQKLTIHLRLNDTFVFDELPSWCEVLTKPLDEACRLLRDPAVRARMRHDVATIPRTAPIDLATLEVEHVRDEANRELLGRTVQELIDAGHPGDALDVFLDVSLREELGVGWTARAPEIAKQFMHHVVTSSIQEPLVMSGSSDGGAHLASFVGADYTTKLLTDHVPGVLSLEQAIWRLTGMPAAVHGLVDRGTIRVGAKADVVVIDLDRLEAGEHEVRADFPGGTERWFVDARGYDMVIVNGVPVMEQGKHTGALPGEVLRGA